MDPHNSISFDKFDGIKSESTPKSILKKRGHENGPRSKVLFSPTKEVKNFKDYFDSTDESLNEDIPNRNGTRKSGQPITNSDYITIEDERLINRVLTDSNIPYVLSLYLQLIFNIVIVVSLTYFIIIFIRTIRSDINNKTELYISDILQDISKCSREFYRNKCDSNIPPILETKCTSWSKCMNRDPQLLGKSQITAEILADILNGFVKPISWKTIFFLVVIVFGSLVITNLAFNTYRHSSNVNVNQLELTIKHQQQLLNQLNDGNGTRTSSSNSQANGFIHLPPRNSQNYLNDLDNLELSNQSPLAKKSLDY